MKGRLVSDRTQQDLARSTEPDRGGKDSVRQCTVRQDKIEPCWVDHGRIDSVERDRAGLRKAGHRRATSSVGQDSARQNGTKHQTEPGKAGKDWAGRQNVGQYWA